MKKIILMLALGTVMSLSASAQDDKKTAGVSLSIGAELGIPTRELADFNKMGFGGTAKLAIPVITNGAITLNSGYLSFPGKVTVSYPDGAPAFNVIPVKAGFRYNFSGGGFYIEPQLGVSFGKSKGFDGITRFTWAPNIGYAISSAIDLSARYESFKTEGGEGINHIGFRVAYNFNLGGK